jgi:hypothetical protein
MVATSGNLWRLSPSLVRLMDETDERAPERSTASDGSIGDAAHASRDSDHNPKAPRPPGWVDAVDITDDDAHGCDVAVLAHHLVAKKDSRVKYLIHKGTIWKGYPNRGYPAFAPQPYTGASPHTNHLHVSITEIARTSTASWWPPAVPPEPPVVIPIPISQERERMAYMIKQDDRPEVWVLDDTGPTGSMRHITSQANILGLAKALGPVAVVDARTFSNQTRGRAKVS